MCDFQISIKRSDHFQVYALGCLGSSSAVHAKFTHNTGLRVTECIIWDVGLIDGDAIVNNVGGVIAGTDFGEAGDEIMIEEGDADRLGKRVRGSSPLKASWFVYSS